jgi:glycosyltransferase involved in cell wall biosynthesis
MKICVVTPLFAIAGVPLAQLRFARALADKGHDVELVVGYIAPQYNFPKLHNVQLVHLNKQQVRGMLAPLIGYLKKNKPDIVFSAEDHLNTITLLAAILSGSSAKISCSSRVTPYDTYSNTPFTKRWILKQLMRIVMPRANVLTCVSKDMVEQYKTVFNSPPHVCVYNIVVDQHSQKKMQESVDEDWFINKTEPLIVAAGRLAPWKGFSDLILAMKELTKSKKARLVIFGDGPMREELQALIDKLELGSVIKLFGYVENPLKYFSRADIFVLSSLVEGLPNVLVEAMMCGCTPVSTDCPTGPREVLQDGKYGYLVPMKDPIAMAVGIEKAIASPIPKNLLHEAIENFSEHEVINRHFNLLGISLQNQGTRSIV